MNRNIWLVAVVLVFLASCNRQKANSEYALRPSDTLVRIELDSLTSNFTYWLDYYYDEQLDSGMLFSLDHIHNEIELYALNEGRLLDKVTYEKEGPSGVGTLIEIGVMGLDSVLIFPPFDNSFYQSRLSDATLKKVTYEKPDEYSSIRSLTNNFSSKAFVDEEFVYTRTLFGGNYMLMENEELSSKPLMYRVNVASGEVEFAYFTFPDDYWADGKRHYELSSVFANNQFAFSFHSDHNVYHGASFNQPLNRKSAKSKYLNQELEDLPLTGGPNERRRYFATAGHYGSLIYDQFRNVYYRFCYPKQEVEPGQDLRELVQFPSTFSIMILDSEFNILGEELIERESKLVPGNVFVGPKGLYISVNHPENPENREDYFSFKLFELVEE